MSEFLENLKNAADTGEFNSDAAKKINEIAKLADSKSSTQSASELDKRLDAVGVKNVTAEEAVALNSQYEKNMEKIKFDDAVNAQIATLIDIDDMIKLSIGDMFDFITELELKFKDKLELTNSKYDDEFKLNESVIINLSKQINDLKSKYSTFINN